MKTIQEITMEVNLRNFIIDLIYHGREEVNKLEDDKSFPYVQAKAQEVIKMVREAQ